MDDALTLVPTLSLDRGELPGQEPVHLHRPARAAADADRAGDPGQLLPLARAHPPRRPRVLRADPTLAPTLSHSQHISSAPTKKVIHSSEYKGRAQLTGRKVLICGTGETGMDLAYESVKAGAKEVYLCSRGGCVLLRPPDLVPRSQSR